MPFSMPKYIIVTPIVHANEPRDVSKELEQPLNIISYWPLHEGIIYILLS